MSSVDRATLSTPMGLDPPAFRISASLPLLVDAALNPRLWLAYDMVAGACALFLGYLLAPKAPSVGAADLQFACLVILITITANIVELYDRNSFRYKARLALRTAVVAAVTVAGLTVFSDCLLYARIGRLTLSATVAILWLFILLPRLALSLAAQTFRTRILLLSDEGAARNIERMNSATGNQFESVGYCDIENSVSARRLGPMEAIRRLCRDRRVSVVVIGASYSHNHEILNLAFACAELGCTITDECSFYEKAFERVPVRQIDASWFYAGHLKVHTSCTLAVKRALDVLVSLTVLVVSAPMMALIGCLVRLTSKGPVLYRQTRCGQFGRTFNIWKFRTMRVDAEENGAQWAAPEDERVTPVGRLLRRSRFDELPQFWNILRGEMSLVGPRPERPEMIAVIERELPLFEFRRWARPGLTGLAQVKYAYGAGIPGAAIKLEHDLYYIKNWSILMDLEILLRTIGRFARGAQ